MDELVGEVHYPGWLRALENEREVAEFVAAMRDAYEQDAPIPVFENLIQEAPVVPIEEYRMLAFSFTSDEVNARPDVLRLLLERNPEIAKHKNDDGNLLLHTAIRFKVSIEVIELILDAYPDAIFEKCEDGFSPLHLACWFETPAGTVELLLSRYPGAASISGGPEGNLPIHSALEYYSDDHSDEHAISGLMDAFPGAASVKGSNEELPLHLACENNYSFHLVKRLVETYPEGLSIRGRYGNLPLHWFCQRQVVSLDHVKFLLDKHPEGISTRNDDGQLPLRCACEARRATLELIEYLIALYPEAVKAIDNGGDLPIHTACDAGASLDVIQLLLDRYTGDDSNHRGLSVANNFGQFPLHYLCFSRGTDTDAVQRLLDLYPEGIRVADRDGRLPLHVACSNVHTSLNTIRPLVEADLYSVLQKSRNGETPYQYQRQWRWQNRNVEIETYLIEKQNEAVAALKDACEYVGATQLGLPDLVVAIVWSFAKPDLWVPADA